jgi:hypothetical protein
MKSISVKSINPCKSVTLIGRGWTKRPSAGGLFYSFNNLYPNSKFFPTYASISISQANIQPTDSNLNKTVNPLSP